MKTLIVAALLLAVTASHAMAQEVQRPISKAYTIGAAGNDCGGRLVAAGEDFYPISAGHPGAYPPTCRVLITNNDPMPTGSNATGAKFVDFVNCDPAQSGTYLWPRQTMEVTMIDFRWVATYCPDLWRVPYGEFVLHVDPNNGSKEWGASDGLSTGKRAIKSSHEALYLALRLMRSNGSLRVKMCEGCTDPVNIHWAPHGSVAGAQGGGAVVVDCNGGRLTSSLQVYFGGVLAIQNCRLEAGASASSNGVLVLNGANNTFVPVKDVCIFDLESQSSIFNNASNINVAGGTGRCLLKMTSSEISLPPVTQTGNITWTWTGAYVGAAGHLSVQGWNTNGYKVNGRKFDLFECGAIDGSRHLPGSRDGQVSCTQAN